MPRPSRRRRALSSPRSPAAPRPRPRRHDFPDVPIHLDYRELLARSDVDAVDIVLPNDLHAEVGVAALARGVDVLLEKPMARTAEECDALLAAAARSGRILSIGHELRLSAQ